jgi:hypothetical protein
MVLPVPASDDPAGPSSDEVAERQVDRPGPALGRQALVIVSLLLAGWS